VPSNGWEDMRGPRQKAIDQGLKGEPGLKVATDPEAPARHPAIASLGDGTSLVVYSGRGGVGNFKIQGVLLRE
jgi:hypothetical protein